MLALIQRLVEESVETGAVRVAVLGCSTGAEVYSVAWTLRSALPGLQLTLHAVDISIEAIEVAKAGIYLRRPTTSGDADIFERMSDRETEEMFFRDGETMTVKPYLKEGIKWRVADVSDASLRADLGPQDIVIANNFLCHMDDHAAETCLRNIAQLLTPGGFLLVSGVSLDVRTRVANDLGWSPVQELLEEIHEGDPCIRRLWPCHYAGLEPLNKGRSDWERRYAVAFRIGASAEQNRGSALQTETPITRRSEACAPLGSEATV
jgi:SAM-dependent methyltransferase